MSSPLNYEIAARFEEIAQLLTAQNASSYRVEAYRRGAAALRELARPVADILREEGVEGLERLPAIGEVLARAVRTFVESGRLPMLDRLRRETDAVAQPEVADLLAVDREYRRRAADGSLPIIAPRRFNPEHRAWLPILRTRRAGRDYTALFSNTQRAHELGRTRDWVVLYVDGAGNEQRYTVVTARLGVLSSKRVIRGRESECLEYYRQHGRHRPAA